MAASATPASTSATTSSSIASSSRSGGVRVDSLDDKYWRASYMEAKRVLALASELTPHTAHR